MANPRTSLLCAGLAALLLAGCSGSSSGSGSTPMSIVRVSNGFGELLPYKTLRLGADGQPTEEVLSIRTEDDLLQNVTIGNPIRPVAFWDAAAKLPSGAPGNHFVYAEFSKPIDIASVLSPLPGLQSQNALTGTVTVTAVDPSTSVATPLTGRVFVNGQTYAGAPTGDPTLVPLQTWVALDGDAIVAQDVDGELPGIGFPGTQGSFAGAPALIAPNVLVFVADDDGNLATHDTFPQGVQIQLRISNAVLAMDGSPLQAQGVASSTVGEDAVLPEVLLSPPPATIPLVTPGGGDVDVDPLTDIRIEFSEPVQPWTVGDLPTQLVAGINGAVTIQFGPDTQRVTVPYSSTPASPYDFTTWFLRPAFNFPGEGPVDAQCGVFNRVDVTVSDTVLSDLQGNLGTLIETTFFETGEGPGIVNAPVAPDTIYLGAGGGTPAISVIDLNGFGQSTGNPAFDPLDPIVEGNSNFPNNPNVFFQGGQLRPPLTPGSCTLDGGSAGVFTLTKDSALNDRVVRSPLLLAVGDMALGASLDSAFRNGPSPFGCQAGGGNLCAADGFKQITTVVDGSTLSPGATNPTGTQILIDGGPNIISWGPSPNPPPLTFPPLCLAPFLWGQEPTSVDTLQPPPVGPGLVNLLVPGDPFGKPDLGVPPSGLLTLQSNNPWQGPSLPNTNINACLNYGMRQQIGHFMYVADRGRQEVTVFNSNRMTVIDRISVPDPTTLAMGTNVDVLAVTNQAVNSVTFIDVNPASSSFHQVIKTTNVGEGPRGIAWEPGNEDILVCNEGGDSISILSGFSLEVRRTVSSNLDRPFEIAITPRQLTFGYLRNVYFAWILNRNGKIALFESGPNGINGWGYDDIIGITSATFTNPKTLQPHPTDLRSGVWVLHERPIDIETGQPTGPVAEGALSHVAITSGVSGTIPLNVNLNLLVNAQLRDMELGVVSSVGETVLSGVPVDIAFDNLLNFGGTPNYATAYSAGAPAILNGKSIVRQTGGAVPTNRARFLFLSVPNPIQGEAGIDVLSTEGPVVRFDTNAFQPGIQSIPIDSVTVLMDYFRQ